MSNAAPGPGPEHTHDTLLPRPPGGTAQGAALSVLVHGGLVAALAWGVAWRAPPPVTVSAELWASVPQEAAPPAEQPPPPAPTPAAQEALQRPLRRPRERALEIARVIALKNPHAIRAAKRLQASMHERGADAILLEESIEQHAIMRSRNQVEAVMAEMERRKPNFEDL